jgi:TusA-related sulfurtransferase
MELNMPDIAGPLGLMKCIAALKQLQAGDILSVTVRDKDVHAALVKVVGNDAGCRMVMQACPEGHHMRVTKS